MGAHDGVAQGRYCSIDIKENNFLITAFPRLLKCPLLCFDRRKNLPQLRDFTLLWSLPTTHLVPLVVLGGSSDRRTMIGAPIFNESSCGCMPGSSRELSSSVNESSCGGTSRSSRELSSSVGYWTASSSLIAVSTDLKTQTSPGNSDIKLLLRGLTFSLSGDRIALSASQVVYIQQYIQCIWVILLKHGPYCDIEVENLKFDLFIFFIADEI